MAPSSAVRNHDTGAGGVFFARERGLPLVHTRKITYNKSETR